MNTQNNPTVKTTNPDTLTLAQRYQARKAKRIEAKRNKRNNVAHKAVMARRAKSASDATRHYMSASDDLMADAIVTRM